MYRGVGTLPPAANLQSTTTMSLLPGRCLLQGAAVNVDIICAPDAVLECHGCIQIAVVFVRRRLGLTDNDVSDAEPVIGRDASLVVTLCM